MDNLFSLLERGAEDIGLDLSTQQINSLLMYKDLLIKWNKVFSLTAITNPKEIVIQHILDGLSAVQLFNSHKKILDVGSGMGVPAIILAIVFPDSLVYALDSNNKKTAFLTQVKIELGLVNLSIITTRVEDYSVTDKFDAITSRAFANMDLFVTLTEHLLADNGIYLAMKSGLGLAESEKLHNWDNQAIELNVPYLDAKRYLIKLERK